MLSVKESINYFVNYLNSHKIPNAQQEVYTLCKSLLNVNYADLIIRKTFTLKQFNTLKKAVKKRAKHVPLQLIIGQSEFLNIKIKESKHTLKPRPETELLTSIITKDLDGKKLKVLDLCCGSGCMGISLSKSGHTVTCADVSKRALKCAKENAKLNNVNLQFVKSNMFLNIHEKFDVIVSNPPYVCTSDIKNLQKEVKKFDPILALDGGADGLNFYRIISQNVHKFLNEKGVLYLECGRGQAKEIKELLKTHFQNVFILNDYNNIQRFIKAVK